MYPETLYDQTAQVLDSIHELKILPTYGFYLAGGTGLALQLGHRKSIDLDFFTASYPPHIELLQALKPHSPIVMHETEGTLDVQINTVKVSFLRYEYPLVNNLNEYDLLKIASVLDIACMKLSAVSSRGSKKDFVDISFILEKYSFDELFQAFEKKFAGIKYQKLHLLKSLLYFNDADVDPDPDYLVHTDWESIKKNIITHTKSYLNTL